MISIKAHSKLRAMFANLRSMHGIRPVGRKQAFDSSAEALSRSKLARRLRDTRKALRDNRSSFEERRPQRALGNLITRLKAIKQQAPKRYVRM